MKHSSALSVLVLLAFSRRRADIHRVSDPHFWGGVFYGQPYPTRITAGPDGNLWFTVQTGPPPPSSAGSRRRE